MDRGFIVGEVEKYPRKTKREAEGRIMDLYLVSETERKKTTERNGQPNRDRSTDESLSPETHLLTRKDGTVKEMEIKRRLEDEWEVEEG